MVGKNASGNIGSEVFPANTGGVTVNNLSPGQVNFAQHGSIAPNHPGEIHYLTQSDGALPPQNLANVLRADAGSCSLQMGCRHTGGSH